MIKNVLAFDCSGENLIVGCLKGSEYNEIVKSASGTEFLLPAVDELLKKVGLTIGDIDVIGVGVGPGSWTGSRVAVVSAYGLSEGNKNLKFFTFNSFDLISYNGNKRGRCLLLARAYANFVYLKKPTGEIDAITKEDLKKNFSDYDYFGVTKVTEDTEIIEVSLEAVMRKKIREKEFVAIDAIEPIYIRKSQAEYQREKRLKGE